MLEGAARTRILLITSSLESLEQLERASTSKELPEQKSGIGEAALDGSRNETSAIETTSNGGVAAGMAAERTSDVAGTKGSRDYTIPCHEMLATLLGSTAGAGPDIAAPSSAKLSRLGFSGVGGSSAGASGAGTGLVRASRVRFTMAENRSTEADATRSMSPGSLLARSSGEGMYRTTRSSSAGSIPNMSYIAQARMARSGRSSSSSASSAQQSAAAQQDSYDPSRCIGIKVSLLGISIAVVDSLSPRELMQLNFRDVALEVVSSPSAGLKCMFSTRSIRVDNLMPDNFNPVLLSSQEGDDGNSETAAVTITLYRRDPSIYRKISVRARSRV